ncbi:hypothetical protein FBZ98_107134 [Rhizobium sp. ERR 922]|nr:hypothetical protein FBZ98_107134 [Rhizobium sp. ERR 922]TWB91633.1 hypothetical protein FBZ97_107134 [Rhizobium sp. ERR 942]
MSEDSGKPMMRAASGVSAARFVTCSSEWEYDDPFTGIIYTDVNLCSLSSSK